tara:strand:+ start:654 stop:956 length:303 start_codon:yes stop_codon:yes gene_type:complete
MKTLSKIVGLPEEAELGDDEELKELWMDRLEFCVHQLIKAGVVFDLQSWSGFTPLERELVARCNTPEEPPAEDLEAAISQAMEALKGEHLAGLEAIKEHA